MVQLADVKPDKAERIFIFLSAIEGSEFIGRSRRHVVIKRVLRLPVVLTLFAICITIWGGRKIHLPANSSLMTAQNIFLVLMCKISDLVHRNLVGTASLALRS